MDKLIVVIMGPGKKHFAEMCLESVKDADKILYWTSAKEIKELNTPRGTEIFSNGWNEKDKATNGKCRNRYLEYLKQNYPNDWALALDEDEILDDDGIANIKKFILEREPGIYNVKMRHFIGDLGHEDATRPVHVVPGRLFKISEAKGYPEHSHPVLEGELCGACLDTTIWHLGHLPVEYMDYILKRYKQHSEDSLIHTQEFLTQWKYSHLFGKYPSKEINSLELPKQICDRWEIDKDMFYHSRYQIEIKHPIMVKQWNDYFKPDWVLDVGCGRGCYLYFWNWFTNCVGFDISEWAVKNAFCKEIKKGDVTDLESFKCGWAYGWELITCIDILEHLTDEQLDSALKNISECGKKFLFSIPFEGDPNLTVDNTHKQFHDKEWWIKKIESYGIKINKTPQDWLFANQILVGEKK
jgi:hypothetical protein